ncbi:MAG: thioredoxin family protein [Proteobacteria bacterium]|nr:thioredoxin family protein [Pseudomonadota bacterium]
MKKPLLLLLALATWVHADAEIGKPAPAFTLPTCESKSVSLSDYKGKVVVLEWTNYGCPFVMKHYGSGNMQKLQADAAAKGVVWLSICSSAPGKQGHAAPADALKACSEKNSAATAYLIDESGATGHAYGAKRTPEMYVINADGILVYHGAIDDKKSADPADIAKAKNLVAAAIDETVAGKPVSIPETEAYGCSIKYGN